MNQLHLPQPGYFLHPGFYYPAPNVIPGATPGLATTFAPPPVPQAPGSSAGVKNASHKFWVDKNPSTSNKMMKDPLFVSFFFFFENCVIVFSNLGTDARVR
jgi:hypothetical protein